MKHTLLVVQLFLLSLNLSAQTLSGRVLDAENETVPYATVMLLSTADSSLVKAGYTEENGTFMFQKFGAGEFQLQITNVGLDDYLSDPIRIDDENQVLELNQIQMTATGTDLALVIVKTTRPLVEILPDKTVFNVENSINATGSDALELLRKSPGVVVDGNDNILLQGKTGVRIYIDGKPSPMAGSDLTNYLRSLQSSEIEAIEIITSPSAKYEAEGNAGILNIRLKKDKRLGMNGTLNAGFGYGEYAKANNSVSMNYRNKQSNYFGTYGLNLGKNTNYNNLLRRQNGNEFDQQSKMLNKGPVHNFKVGADYFLNSKHTVGVMINGNVADRDLTNSSRTPFGSLETGEIEQILVADNTNDMHRTNVNANLNYNFRDTLGNSFTMDADYGVFRSSADSWQPNTYLNPLDNSIISERFFRTDAPTDINIYTFKGDYERRFLGGQLGLGFKFALVETDNTFDFFNVVDNDPILDIDRSNQFKYDERVNAAYFTFNRSINQQWAFQVGLRVENTNSQGDLISQKDNGNENVKRNYTDLFPNAGITYNLNQKNSFGLNYSRRIDRPNYQDLNPFEFKLDELTFQRGNPFLRPQYTNSVQLRHTYAYRLNTSISYSHTSDFFARLTQPAGEGSNASYITQENIADRKNLSLNVSMPFSVAKWWQVYANASVYNTDYYADFGEGNIVDLNATAFNFYAQNTFMMPKGFKLQLSGFYNSPGIWGGTFESFSMYSVDAGLQKSFFDNKATVKLSVSDIFNTMQWGGVSDFGGLYIEARGGWESRQLKLNVSYNFGNDQVESARKRKTGLEEENNRIGS